MSFMNPNLLYWIWLTTLPYIGSVTARNLLEYFGEIQYIYHASPDAIMKTASLQKRQQEILINRKSLKTAEVILEKCEFLQSGILTIDDPEYPDRCRGIRDISPVLYYKGDNRINTVPTVGMIGARRCSEKGKTDAIQLAQEKCEAGCCIVSGFAKGIDSYAHTAAIKAAGYTIGVLGNGIDICYPPEQSVLKEAMEKHGLLLTPYPPGTIPQRFTFPSRNKLIAALSDELYVIEKGKVSGTQSTIEAAEKYGKRIQFLQTAASPVPGHCEEC